MPVELAAVVFDGAYTAERELNNLRVSRLDPWVGEVAVLQHYDVGANTRLLLGLVGAIIGLSFGVPPFPRPTGAPVVPDDVAETVLPADASALILVAESTAADIFVSAVAPRAGRVFRQELTSDEQMLWRRFAATRG
jgi:hypothetical protein